MYNLSPNLEIDGNGYPVLRPVNLEPSIAVVINEFTKPVRYYSEFLDQFSLIVL